MQPQTLEHPLHRVQSPAPAQLPRAARGRPPQDHLKRALDVVLSAAALVAGAPLLLPAMLAVRATMGPPVLFRQVRPGLGGRPFELVKLRTMRPPRPEEDPVDSGSDEARITRLGALLRRASIDELPTLLNVLRGDMSLVGPRPLLMHYLPRYSAEQARRHEVKPGITGLAQVLGRNALSWEEKLALDVRYVRERSLWLDLKILALTVRTVLRRDGVSHAGHVTMPEFLGSANGAAHLH